MLNWKFLRHILRIVMLFSLALACSSLSTQKKFYEPITADLQDGNYEAAIKGLEKAKEKNKFTEKDRFIYFLDAGLANYYASRFDSSKVRLTEAEQAAEELYTKSISRAAASLFLNDNVLEYSGEDYEVLYTNLIKALNYLALDDAEGAFVEIRRANLKLDLLKQKYVDAAEQYQKTVDENSIVKGIKYDVPDVRFNNDAFARYLSMHLYASEGKLDDARIDYNFLQDAFITQPDVYDFSVPEVQYYADQGSILSIVALAGMSPVKEGLSLRLRTDKDLNLVQVLYDGPGKGDEEYGHFVLPVSEDYYFKFAIPVLENRPSRIDRVFVVINGKKAGQLQLLEDVGNVARETFEAKKTIIYIRTLARAIIKGLSAHGLKEKADSGGFEGWLKKALIDVGTDILENPDLRCSRLLPGRVYVADFVLQPGDYDITFDFVDVNGNVLESKSITKYRVLERGLNLVQAFSLK